ncbi:hypothetical protein CIK52_01620 [Kocuria rosea]|uniref:hypothetical protein n=1 Tax=Kocuria rosea TaxID=1275 RepID=UPI000D652F02|nr:hypothetical protein [Kocuria rosea]PWF88023.1 hypothetical protein CIK52_01620 [Kocuria rosea]QCY32633.1 hypothetical protein EQG70_06840 [Kocuria rosea]TQN34686.1 hypothetical protein FHX38_2790 [Kocuria rosea]
MTTTATEQPQDAPQEPQGPAEEPQDAPEDAQAQDDVQGEKGNREAAKYRTRLRAAEADLTATRAQVTALQSAAVARELNALEVPAEVFALVHEPGEFIGADGTVDRDALVAAAGAVRERFNLRTPVVAPTAPALAAGGERPASRSSWAEKLQS